MNDIAKCQQGTASFDQQRPQDFSQKLPDSIQDSLHLPKPTCKTAIDSNMTTCPTLYKNDWQMCKVALKAASI